MITKLSQAWFSTSKYKLLYTSTKGPLTVLFEKQKSRYSTFTKDLHPSISDGYAFDNIPNISVAINQR